MYLMKSVLGCCFLALILLAACAPSSPSYTETPAELDVSVNQIFKVTLETNPTTGYGWQLARALNPDLLHLEGAEYQANKQKEKMVGSGGQVIWTFKALAPGRTEIHFKYVRPWEKNSQPVKNRMVSVSIR